jgi:hypothetical protein
MVLFEFLIIFLKNILMLLFIFVFNFKILFAVLDGGVSFYYTRCSNFLNIKSAYSVSRNLSSKFKPIFKNTVFNPLGNSYFLKVFLTKNIGFKNE